MDTPAAQQRVDLLLPHLHFPNLPAKLLSLILTSVVPHITCRSNHPAMTASCKAAQRLRRRAARESACVCRAGTSVLHNVLQRGFDRSSCLGVSATALCMVESIYVNRARRGLFCSSTCWPSNTVRCDAVSRSSGVSAGVDASACCACLQACMFRSTQKSTRTQCKGLLRQLHRGSIGPHVLRTESCVLGCRFTAPICKCSCREKCVQKTAAEPTSHHIKSDVGSLVFEDTIDFQLPQLQPPCPPPASWRAACCEPPQPPPRRPGPRRRRLHQDWLRTPGAGCWGRLRSADGQQPGWAARRRQVAAPSWRMRRLPGTPRRPESQLLLQHPNEEFVEVGGSRRCASRNGVQQTFAPR